MTLETFRNVMMVAGPGVFFVIMLTAIVMSMIQDSKGQDKD